MPQWFISMVLAICKLLFVVPWTWEASSRTCTDSACHMSKSEIIRVAAGILSESAVIHSVSYYQQQFASGLVPVSTHVSILHKGPECNIPLDFRDLVQFQHIIKSATLFTTSHFVLKRQRLKIGSFLLSKNRKLMAIWNFRTIYQPFNRLFCW